MKLVPMTKAVLAVAAVGALRAGCATRLEMGPGYYHYDSRVAIQVTVPSTIDEPVVIYRESAVVK